MHDRQCAHTLAHHIHTHTHTHTHRSNASLNNVIPKKVETEKATFIYYSK